MNITELILRSISYAVFGITPILVIAALVIQNMRDRVHAYVGNSSQRAPHLEFYRPILTLVRTLAAAGAFASLIMYLVYTSLYGIFM